MAKNDNLKDFLTDVADAIREKKGTTDLINPQDFHDEILSIDTGEAEKPYVEEKDVNFYDYDGTLLFSYTIAEAQALTELPTPPSHEGLVFDGWNWDYEDVIALDYPMDIGAMYNTDDGAMRLYLNFIGEKDRSVNLQTKIYSGSFTIDWGDGGSETVTPSSPTIIPHIYAEEGKYVISLSGFAESPGFIDNAFFLDNRLGNSPARKAFYGMALGACKGFANGAFMQSTNLQFLIFSNTKTYFNSKCFSGCPVLKWVNMPKESSILGEAISISGIEGMSLPKSLVFGSIPYCINLRKICLPDGLTGLLNTTFNYCVNLRRFDAPATLASIGSYAFSYCNICYEYNFTRCTQIPTLASTNAFSSWVAFNIVVPDALYDEWIAATNWATYADKIVKSSEYTE